jgi:ferric enterobactin receptor
MRTVFLLLFSAILSISSYAQTTGKGKIGGKVTDAVTKQPVDYATISVFKQGAASPFNGTSTDAKGVFNIDNVPAGDYKVTVDFLGYKRTTIDHVLVADGGNTPALANIMLAPIQNELTGVTITAKAPIIEKRIDKMV